MKRLRGARTQDWYSKLSADEREAYKLKFPGTRFEHKNRITLPEDDPVPSVMKLQAKSRLKASKARQ